MKNDYLKALNDAKNIHLFLQSIFNTNAITLSVKITICVLLASDLSHRTTQLSKEHGKGLKYNVLSAVKALTKKRNDKSLKLSLL